MRAKAIVPAAVAAVGLTALTAWLLAWPFEKAAMLAPVIVATAGAVAGLLVLWGRVAWESLRQSRRPGLIVVLSLAGLALLVGLSILGLKLPRE
jgi:hypothetical protein